MTEEEKDTTVANVGEVAHDVLVRDRVLGTVRAVDRERNGPFVRESLAITSVLLLILDGAHHR
jgi:hypothetical protein